MAARRTSQAVHALNSAMIPVGDEANDGLLLDRFIDGNDELAFAAIVRRHAGLVWGVCRRLLGHHHDAEDAFQATFLVLARKAASIRPRAMVGNWLYGVAYRTALKAKIVAGRRDRMEKQAQIMPEAAPPADDPLQKLEPLLDQELARLPDKYRVAIVLCYFQGKTGKEAARQLKIPEGTLSTRLRTARGMLAKRLERHRIRLSEAALAVLLAEQASAAPSAAVSTAIKAAALVGAGQAAASGVVSTQVINLSEGVLRAMLLTKIKRVTTLLLLLSLAVFGGIRLLHQTGNAQEKKVDVAVPPADRPAADVPKLLAAAPAPKRNDDRTVRLQEFTVTGRAVDEEGKPLPGATIFLVSTMSPLQRLLGTTTTDKEGRYAFRKAELPYCEDHLGADFLLSGHFQLFGKAPDRPFAWDGMKQLNIDPRFAKRPKDSSSYFPGDKIEIDVRFAQRKKIEGRIVNENGEPIAGVELRLGNCDFIDNNGKPEYMNYREFFSIHQAASIMPEQVNAKTDDKGRFEFPFVPNDVFCRVLVQHPGYADMSLYASSVDNPPKTTEMTEEQPILKAPLQLALHPVRTIRVQVRSKQSGQPVAGVKVSGYQQRASGRSASYGTADKEGNVTLKLPPGKYELFGEPPITADFLRTYQELVVENEPKEQSVVLRQELGCAVILKAIDADTGKGISGAMFDYEFEANGRRHRGIMQAGFSSVDKQAIAANAWTNSKGELRNIVPPGTRRYTIGGPPDGYESDDDDRTQGREVELTAGKTITLTFRLRKKSE